MGIEDVLADDPDIADLLPGELFEIFLIGFGGAHFGFLVARGYGDRLVKQAGETSCFFLPSRQRILGRPANVRAALRSERQNQHGNAYDGNPNVHYIDGLNP